MTLHESFFLPHVDIYYFMYTFPHVIFSCVFQLPIVDDELKKAAGENKEDGRLEKHTTLN